MALSGPQVEKQHRLNARSQVDAVSSCFIQVPLIAKTLLNSKVIDIWSMACVSVEPSEKFMEYMAMPAMLVHKRSVHQG